MKYDVIIIGGGMSGAWLSYFLSKEGKRVLLLEKDFFGSGTTAKSAATIEYFYPTKWDIEMRLEGLKLYREFAPENYHQTGTLHLITDEKDLEILKENYQNQKSLGIEVVELTPKNIKKFYKDMALENIPFAFLSKDTGYIDTYEVIQKLVKASKEHGSKSLTHHKVLDFDIKHNKIFSLKVKTSDNTIEEFYGDIFVNAAGPWSMDINRKLNIKLPISKTQGNIAVVKLPIDYHLPMVINHSTRVYFREDVKSVIMIGQFDRRYDENLLKLDPDSPPNIPEDYIPFVLEDISKYFPVIEQGRLVNSWVGIRAVTKDGRPIAGKVKYENFFILTGFSGSGIQLSPITAKLLSELIIKNDVPNNLKPYLPDRFKDGV